MKSRDLAASLFIHRKEKQADLLDTLLHILSQTEGISFPELYAEYHALVSGTRVAVRAKCFGEISASMKKIVEEKVKTLAIGDYVIVYERDDSLLGGYQLFIGDQLSDYSLLSKVIASV